MRCHAMSDVLWNVSGDAMSRGIMVWYGHVEHSGVLMQDVKCGCGIPSDVEWFDTILDRHGGVMRNDS